MVLQQQVERQSAGTRVVGPVQLEVDGRQAIGHGPVGQRGGRQGPQCLSLFPNRDISTISYQ